MARYRKKPVEVEAIQYKIIKEVPCKYGIAKESNSMEIAEFMKAPFLREVTVPSNTPEGRTYVEIETLEGTMQANLGDYIIKGVKGEFYPCKPDIFEETYERSIEK